MSFLYLDLGLAALVTTQYLRADSPGYLFGPRAGIPQYIFGTSTQIWFSLRWQLTGRRASVKSLRELKDTQNRAWSKAYRKSIKKKILSSLCCNPCHEDTLHGQERIHLLQCAHLPPVPWLFLAHFSAVESYLKSLICAQCPIFLNSVWHEFQN